MYGTEGRDSCREALATLGAVGAALALGCESNSPTSPTVTADAGTGGTTTGACAVSPTETVGPYPSRTELIRSDIREGRSGTTLNLTISFVDVNNN
jgi:hypothetical protein